MDNGFAFDSLFISKKTEWNPKPDNDNLRLLPGWMTPAELLQWVRQEKKLMQKELAANFRLRSDSKHRNDWENLEGLERCTMERYFAAR